jgi:DNA end-binding protein Ku
MRGREHLAAIFATGGMLRAATLRFATELRTPQEVGLPAAPSIAAKERRAFERLLDELPSADDPDLSLLEDETGNKLRELAERKAAAGDDVIEVADAETRESGESAEIIDIMSVLKRRMGAREKRQ